ncbi:type II methylase [Helicobacter pylori]|uniref:type II methylase n=1 Tax=Helicobacter pylori TaxID=210 RepID=UPI001AA1F529|nr:type II methylase [Helicobacter pylori]GHR71003.1 hypothetical protein JP0105_01710 [Helicobacter pylori]
MVSNTTLQKNLDAFYTHPKIARFCLDLLKDLINQNLGLDLNAFHFLEPSAGSGSFVGALKGLGIADCLALDIAPKAQGIQKKDYLLELIEFNKKYIIIGNPPFGHRGKLALNFLNKSLNEAPIVAFILPNLFKRYSIQKHIDKRAKLVLNADLEKNAFIFNERPYDVNKDEESLKNALKDLENPFGFAPYIRKAYEHKKEFSNHHQIESFFSHNHILREQNVLEFLKTLTH